MAREPARDTDEGSVLPDFCGLPAVFAVVVAAELLAFLLALLGGFDGFWGQLARLSLLLQWV
ncbi:MAG TPA: sensor histidine kinase, partial [Gammaproteobacteria bacterium]|nr:sensor histidine kinase [Gammaproteobacteria bacterium]